MGKTYNGKLIQKAVGDKTYNVPEPRPLTHKERKALRTSGMGLDELQEKAQGSGVKAIHVLWDFTDHMLETYYPDFDCEEIPDNLLQEVAIETYKMSFASPEEVKNS